MLIPEFTGGLGNMMFQMGSTYAIAKATGHSFGIIDIPFPPPNHSFMNYKETIFKDWYFYKTNRLPSRKIIEHNAAYIDKELIQNITDDHAIIMSGYFQKHHYLDAYREEVLQLFDLPFYEDLKRKYHDISNAYFIHVRRGDYVGNPFHEMDLTNYYKRAMDMITKEDKHAIAYVVSNDIEWCKQWSLLDSVPHRYIEENEVDTLTIMSHCGKGGIAANSSFSWWGLYANINRPYLILPSRWYPHNIMNTDGYYFKEATVVPT